MAKDQLRSEILESEGWERKFIASEPRLSEAVEVYKEAGFEIHLEPLPKEPECNTCTGEEEKNEGECRVCFQGMEDKYKIIYARLFEKESSSDDDSL
jgi:hypothetical protein